MTEQACGVTVEVPHSWCPTRVSQAFVVHVDESRAAVGRRRVRTAPGDRVLEATQRERGMLPDSFTLFWCLVCVLSRRSRTICSHPTQRSDEQEIRVTNPLLACRPLSRRGRALCNIDAPIMASSHYISL